MKISLVVLFISLSPILLLLKRNCNRRLAVYMVGHFSSNYDSWSFQYK